ncbi:MAG: hypothetical protein WCD27_02030, partial [Candidatus Acidiferrales bacterium]
YGNLIMEMGIVAPLLWLIWTGSVLYFGGKVVYGLRETRFFPIAFAIWWYAFLLLYPLVYGSLGSYQNYINNAYFLLLLGILFRLPETMATAPADAAVVRARSGSRHRGFQS